LSVERYMKRFEHFASFTPLKARPRAAEFTGAIQAYDGEILEAIEETDRGSRTRPGLVYGVARA
jgi:hypothetical protein